MTNLELYESMNNLEHWTRRSGTRGYRVNCLGTNEYRYVVQLFDYAVDRGVGHNMIGWGNDSVLKTAIANALASAASSYYKLGEVTV